MNIENNKKSTIFIRFTKYNTFLHIIYNHKKNTSYIKNKQLCCMKTISCGQFNKLSGKRKSTPFAMRLIALKALTFIFKLHIYSSHIIIKGFSYNRYVLIKALETIDINNNRLKVLSISDKTNLPHNGCKLPVLKKIK